MEPRPFYNISNKHVTFTGLTIFERKGVHFPHIFCLCISLLEKKIRMEQDVLQCARTLNTKNAKLLYTIQIVISILCLT